MTANATTDAAHNIAREGKGICVSLKLVIAPEYGTIATRWNHMAECRNAVCQTGTQQAGKTSEVYHDTHPHGHAGRSVHAFRSAEGDSERLNQGIGRQHVVRKVHDGQIG